MDLKQLRNATGRTPPKSSLDDIAKRLRTFTYDPTSGCTFDQRHEITFNSASMFLTDVEQVELLLNVLVEQEYRQFCGASNWITDTVLDEVNWDGDLFDFDNLDLDKLKLLLAETKPSTSSRYARCAVPTPTALRTPPSEGLETELDINVVTYKKDRSNRKGRKIDKGKKIHRSRSPCNRCRHDTHAYKNCKLNCKERKLLLQGTLLVVKKNIRPLSEEVNYVSVGAPQAKYQDLFGRPIGTYAKAQVHLRLKPSSPALPTCGTGRLSPLNAVIDRLFRGRKFSGNKVFSQLDFSDAYNQPLLDEAYRPLITITTHRGLFQYNRLVLGLKPNPAIFQHTLET
ncbi:hypothetical protein HUJ04_011536 [Dendroctonus ponderosae]|nr:hypothetical protein HUJ04_011536 [Dendroctonus ponderosae]